MIEKRRDSPPSRVVVVMAASANGDKAAGPVAIQRRASSATAEAGTAVSATAAAAVSDGRNALRRVVSRAFEDKALEEAYQTYVQRSKSSDLDCFFLTGCLVAVHTAVCLSLEQQAITTADPTAPPHVGVLVSAGFSCIVALTMASLGFFIRSRKPSDPAAAAAAAGAASPRPAISITDRLIFTAWLLANVLIVAQLVFVPISWALTWLLLFNFLTCITLSVRLRVCLLLTSSASLLFLALSIWISWDNPVADTLSTPLHQQVRKPQKKNKRKKKTQIFPCRPSPDDARRRRFWTRSHPQR